MCSLFSAWLTQEDARRACCTYRYYEAMVLKKMLRGESATFKQVTLRSNSGADNSGCKITVFGNVNVLGRNTEEPEETI